MLEKSKAKGEELIYLFDDWQVIPSANEIIQKNESYTLEPRVMRALCVLIEHQQQVVEREALIKAVWPENVIVSDQSVTQLLGNLRKVLHDSARAPKYIQTIPKRGYRFIAQCEERIQKSPTLTVETANSEQLETNDLATTVTATRKENLTTTALDSAEHPLLNSQQMKRLNRIILLLLVIGSVVYGWVQKNTYKESIPFINQEDKSKSFPEKSQSTAQQTAYLSDRTPHVRPLTNSPGVERFPTVSPNGKWLAFSWEDYQTETNIFIKSLDDSSAKRIQLTFDGARELKAVWSPDSTHIAFARFTGENECTIVTMNIDTRKQTFITQCSNSQFSAESIEWSADNQLYFKAKNSHDERTGLSRIRISTDMPAPVGAIASKLVESIPCEKDCQFDDMDISVSPDNQLMLLTRQVSLAGQDLYLYPTDLSAPEQRITHDAVQILGHTFSENSQAIFYVSLKMGAPVLWRYDIASQKHTRIDLGNITPTYPSRIPLQNSLIFTRQERQFYISQVKLATDAQQAPIVQSYASNFDPAVNAEGKELAYTSGVSGKSEVWRVDLETMQYEQITDSEIGSLSPAWSADGKKLVYVNYADREHPRLGIYSVESKTQTFIQTDLEALWGPQFSQDGQEILVSGVKNNRRHIWAVNLETQTTTPISSEKGFVVRSDPSNPNLLFFTKERMSGLWTVNRKTGEEQQVLTALQDTHPAAWAVSEHYITYLFSDAEHDYVKQFNRKTGDSVTRVSLPKKSAARYTTGGLSLRQQQEHQYVLFVHNGILQADIFRVDL